MKRLLPPLVVLLFLGFVAWRVAQEPRREATRDRIQSGVGAATMSVEGMKSLLDRLETYLAQNPHNLDDRLFVARTLVEVQQGSRAMEILWADPGYREKPGAGGDIAGMLLQAAAQLGEKPEGPAGPSEEGANLATVILAEGGHAEAGKRLDWVMQTAPWQMFRQAYYATMLYGSAGVREIVTEDLRARKEPEADTLAAILAMRPEDYPNREADLQRLLEVVQGVHRQEHRIVWSVAAVALGRSGSEEARSVLQEAATELAASELVPDREDGAFAALGLVASGDWSALAHVTPFLGEPRLNPMILQWAINVLALRWQQGDEAALEPILKLWNEGPRRGPHRPRLRLAFELFLRDHLPEVGDPIDRLAASLEAEDANEAERLQGAAIRRRRGESAAVDELVQGTQLLLREMTLSNDIGLVDPLVHSPPIQALRALYLYDR